MALYLRNLLIAALLSVPGAVAAAPGDEAAVRQVSADYVLGFYTGSPDLLAKSLHPTLRKIGWTIPEDSEGYAGPHEMDLERAKRVAPQVPESLGSSEDSPYTIIIQDLADKTAAVKVEALWGIDYMHLAKDNEGRWMIYNIIWQNLPDTAEK